jgi:hypothetical protein
LVAVVAVRMSSSHAVCSSETWTGNVFGFRRVVPCPEGVSSTRKPCLSATTSERSGRVSRVTGKVCRTCGDLKQSPSSPVGARAGEAERLVLDLLHRRVDGELQLHRLVEIPVVTDAADIAVGL